MAALLDDFAVDEGGDFRGGVVCWAVEFIGLGGGAVVFAHNVEGLADVNGLKMCQTRSWKRGRGM